MVMLSGAKNGSSGLMSFSVLEVCIWFKHKGVDSV